LKYIYEEMTKKVFVNIKDVGKTYFSSCDNCENNCCSAPMVVFAPLVLDDFQYVYKNFPIQFAYINKELKALMLINKGEGSCKYYKDNKCQIYEERPPACKMFPISPFLNDFYISSKCQALSSDESKGKLICDEKSVNDDFLHPRVNNFVEKLENTTKFLDTIKDDLVKSIKVSGTQLYNYDGQSDNLYIDMYKNSLVHL